MVTDKNALVERNEIDLNGLITLAGIFSKSGFFADAREASQAVVKIMAGKELGIPPVASMTGINVIKGKVILNSNLLASLVKDSQRYDYKITRLDDTGCSIDFFDNGERVGVSSFNQDDARKAKLLVKDTYASFPRNMYFARALSNGVKWFCPNISSGIALYVTGEITEDYQQDNGNQQPIVEYVAPDGFKTAMDSGKSDDELMSMFNLNLLQLMKAKKG